MILVLEDGEAKETGSHEELMRMNGIYRSMFEQQQLEAAVSEQKAALDAEHGQEARLQGGVPG